MPSVSLWSTSRPPAAVPIRAVCFDLDGTLVETEALKAATAADAAVALCPGAATHDEVAAAYGAMAGWAREAVGAEMVRRFGLGVPAGELLDERLRRYEAMLADHALVRRQEYPAATALLRAVRARGYRTGVATMSHRAQALEILEVLGVAGDVEVLVGRDEVRAAKPDPEIYLALAGRLALAPAACLAIEDSVPGIGAALAAGLTFVAATTALTRDSVHAEGGLPARLIVDRPEALARTVNAILAADGAHG